VGAAAQLETFVEVELFVCEEPPFDAVDVVEDCVPASLDPSWPVLAEEPVEVVVPAELPDPEPV
jgi:hypothetical protein